MANIWARKSTAELLNEAAEGDGINGEVRALRRTLSALNLIALGVGGIIGAGIFVLTGHAAAANAGPAIVLSFILGAIACGFAGLCYAEMASTFPVAGSATMGECLDYLLGFGARIRSRRAHGCNRLVGLFRKPTQRPRDRAAARLCR